MQQKDTPPARILVVDDERVILDVLQEFLEFEGYRVVLAGSAEQALQILARESFDVVLTDLKMPGMGGLELLRRIKEEEMSCQCVMMTGFGTVETAIEAMKFGAFDYVLKPFRPADVLTLLERVLERQRLERENLALKELVSFYEVSEALSAAAPVEEQLDFLVRKVRENFGADGVAVLQVDREMPDKVQCRATAGMRAWGDANDALLRAAAERPGGLLAHGGDVQRLLPEVEKGVQSVMSVPLTVQGQTLGALTAVSAQPGRRFGEGQRKGLSIFGARAADAMATARAYGDLQRTFSETIEGLARALEAKDAYTHGHSDRVSRYSALIAEAMGLSRPEVDTITRGGLMHDIGKIGIPSAELNKPRRLTDAEYAQFKSHPVQGRRIIEPIGFLVHVVPCVYHHHESFDGTGYPDKLRGEDIPLEARILAVADTYDAMTSDRPYRKALPHFEALAELRRCAGQQFDPNVVQAFLGAIEAFREECTSRGLAVPY